MRRPSTTPLAFDGGCCTKPSAKTWAALAVTVAEGPSCAEAGQGAPRTSETTCRFFEPALRKAPVGGGDASDVLALGGDPRDTLSDPPAEPQPGRRVLDGPIIDRRAPEAVSRSHSGRKDVDGPPRRQAAGNNWTLHLYRASMRKTSKQPICSIFRSVAGTSARKSVVHYSQKSVRDCICGMVGSSRGALERRLQCDCTVLRRGGIQSPMRASSMDTIGAGQRKDLTPA
jgi:hypothetical protein